MSRPLLAGGMLVGAAAASAIWWRKHPSACPYGQRFWVEVPHPFITRDRLRDALAPKAGETMLEVGPGTGYYALPVAEWLSDGGTLHIFDAQQEMLDHTLRRAGRHGITNLVPSQGDARTLPYGDAQFDAAYLVLVLGEIPDQEAALSELRRVVKTGGRVIVGELLGSPHGHCKEAQTTGRTRWPALRAARRPVIRLLRRAPSRLRRHNYTA